MKTVYLCCALLLGSISALVAQSRNVTVDVITAKGKSASATVAVASTKVSQKTSKNGPLTVRVNSDNDSLVVVFNNYMGMVPVGDATAISLCVDKGVLSKAENGKPSAVTYSTVKLPVFNSNDISSMPDLYIYPDLIALIKAKFPSIKITSAGAIISGTTSANSQPMALIIVDGSEVQSLDQANGMLSVYDLQSIEVKRSDTIYGIRGAGGVIEIKTKTGRNK